MVHVTKPLDARLKPAKKLTWFSYRNALSVRSKVIFNKLTVLRIWL